MTAVSIKSTGSICIGALTATLALRGFEVSMADRMWRRVAMSGIWQFYQSHVVYRTKREWKRHRLWQRK